MIAEILSVLGISDVDLGATIGGLFSFAGIFLTGLLGILAWLGKQWFVRREARRDLLQALRAEIAAVWKQFGVYGNAQDLARELKRRFDKQGARYTPLVLPHTGASIFSASIGKLGPLREDEIGTIVSFYRQLQAVEWLADYMRGDDYRNSKDVERKRLIASDYLASTSELIDAAEVALELIDERLRTKPHKRLASLKKRAGVPG